MNTESNVRYIDWQADGYYGFPQTAARTRPAPNLAERYKAWLTAFERATQGNFKLLPGLVELYLQSDDDFILQHLCATLLGDAGTPPCFERIIEVIEEGLPKFMRYETNVDFCDALFERGRLADVPLMLAVYEKHSSVDEAAIIPCYISELLEYPVTELAIPTEFKIEGAYRAAVMNRYEGLVAELGSNQQMVFAGKRFGVVPLAKLMLERFREPHVQPFWRQKFEASTGINCTEFYRDRVFQPLAASAIVEDFLESPEAANYEDGVRYFFGHRIPN